MPDKPGPDVTAVAGAAFLAELVLLAMLATAGARLVHGIGGIVLAAALLALVAALWGRWLAPRAPRRCGHPARLFAKTGLSAVAAALLAASGLPVLAVVLLAGVGTVLAAAERSEVRRTGR